jgi:hypothetical protein
LERNRRLLAGKNPRAAALWLASFRRFSLLTRLAEAAGANTASIRKAAKKLRAVAIRRYLPALLLYVQRRLEGGRGFLVAVRTRDMCGVDGRCCAVVSLVKRRAATSSNGDALWELSSCFDAGVWYVHGRVG